MAKNQKIIENASCRCDEDSYIDILEQDIVDLCPELLKILLKDKTTGRNIIWACDEYVQYGADYKREAQIFQSQITGLFIKVIRPRIAKTKEEQTNRTKSKAEVFTPSWLCNEMNNYCDNVWFERENVFNKPRGQHDWTVITDKIEFTNPKKNWQAYVDSRRLEITCGEGPYLVSRYDTTTGKYLPVEKRIGILDRKLRIVDENTTKESDWIKWAIRAYQSTYGYEYQGDNLLLARENLLWTFIDYYKCKFGKNPTTEMLTNIAKIIAWNVWQMDGLTGCPPHFLKNDTQSPCKLQDWRCDRPVIFNEIKGAAK